MARIKASEKMERIIKMLNHIKATAYDSDDMDILIYRAITLKNEILIEEEMRKKQNDLNRTVGMQGAERRKDS